MTEITERILILFISVMAAGGLVLVFPTLLRPHYKMMLAFSGAFLLGITVTHILPEAYHAGGGQVGLFVIGGFLLQIILEYFSGGIEHGHIHSNKEVIGHKEKAISWVMLLSLCIHNLVESMPLGFHDDHGHAHHSHDSYLWAIVIHKVPITIALIGLMVGLKVSRARTLLFLFVFAMAAPIGILAAPLLSNGSENTLALAHIMGLAGGIILHVSTTILLEASENHRFNFYKMVVIVIGFGLAVVSS